MKQSVLIFLVAFIIDQSTKYFFLHTGSAVLNSGISFNFLYAIPSLVLTVGLGVCISGLWFAFRSYWDEHTRLAALFFAGALSNLLDRVLYGAVVDWLPIPGLAIHNNLADWYIAVSLIAVLYTYTVSVKT